MLSTARGSAANIVAATLELRSAINLPHRFVALAEPANSLIVLDTDTGSVTWYDANDVAYLDTPQEMSAAPDTWPTYADFFEFLLDREDEQRADG